MEENTAQLNQLSEDVHQLNGRMTKVEDRLTKVEDRLTDVENRLINVEEEVCRKNDVLEHLAVRSIEQEAAISRLRRNK